MRPPIGIAGDAITADPAAGRERLRHLPTSIGEEAVNADRALVKRHIEALRADAAAQQVPADVIGRLLLQAAIDTWQGARGWQDIARELVSVAENLDPDSDHEFMRP
jgi:hypothetical protein